MISVLGGQTSGRSAAASRRRHPLPRRGARYYPNIVREDLQRSLLYCRTARAQHECARARLRLNATARRDIQRRRPTAQKGRAYLDRQSLALVGRGAAGEIWRCLRRTCRIRSTAARRSICTATVPRRASQLKFSATSRPPLRAARRPVVAGRGRRSQHRVHAAPLPQHGRHEAPWDGQPLAGGDLPSSTPPRAPSARGSRPSAGMRKLLHAHGRRCLDARLPKKTRGHHRSTCCAADGRDRRVRDDG